MKFPRTVLTPLKYRFSKGTTKLTFSIANNSSFSPDTEVHVTERTKLKQPGFTRAQED